jgi:hypothetical protein
MLHACLYTICLVFCYTLWHFYAFSRTNLLTRCHSVSSLFSAIFVFQKSYTGNILGIGQNKSQTSYYLTKLPEDQRGDGGGATDTSQTYLYFLMLHTCFYTICLVFRYTLWYFYAFFGTNLLTRCHSASSLSSTVFVFQKSYIENILGIGRNKSQTSRYLTKLPEDRRGDEDEPRAGHTTGWCGPAPGRAPYVWDRLGPLLTLPLRL